MNAIWCTIHTTFFIVYSIHLIHHETQYPEAFQLVGPNGVAVKRDDVTQYANVLNDAPLITQSIANRTCGIFVHAEAQVL